MFHVSWVGKAFDQMGQLLRNNPARQVELAEALRDLTARLHSHADTAGESRGGNLRVVFTGPLTVYFVADSSNLMATVIRVRARFTA